MLKISNDIIGFLQTALSLWGLVSLAGFAVYKCKRADSWEDGTKAALTGGIKFIFAAFSGETDMESQINTSLCLTDAEVLDLVDCFENRPFDTPSLASPVEGKNGCIWIYIKANGFISTYRNTPIKQLRTMAESIVQRFYQRARNFTAVTVYVKIMASDGMLLAIPLSVSGERFLAEQEEDSSMPEKQISDSIEEEFDLFDDGKED